MRLCAEKNCARKGIALSDSEFGRNAYYERVGRLDGIHIYCKNCCARKVDEYRERVQDDIRLTNAKIPYSMTKEYWRVARQRLRERQRANK